MTGSGSRSAPGRARFGTQNGLLGAVRWWLLALGAALVAVLAVTGGWLWFEYRPSTAQAWGDGGGAGQAVRIVHRWASHLLVNGTLILLVVVLADRAVRRRWPLVVGAVATAVAASATGFLLPWDQLALREITVGAGVGGMAALWEYEILFVIIDGVEVGGDTMRRWAVAHVAIPTVALLALALVWASRCLRPAAAIVDDDERWRPPTSG